MARSRTRVRVVSNRAVVVDAVRKTMRRKVAAMGAESRRTVVNEVLVGERTGRWYYVPGTTRLYRASRAGEAPATRTGDLRRSYQVGKLKETAGRVQVQVGTAIPYGPILEGPMDREHLGLGIRLAEPRLRQILMGDWGI